MSLPNNYECEGQMSIDDWLNPDSWSGKTYPERSVQTKERTSDVFLKKQRKSSAKMPLFLDLRTENGHPREQSWVMGGLLHGEYMMHSFGEYPSEENVSRLSQILEVNPHPKYYLSVRACQGILNRAERRGKTLPPILKEALIQQVTRSKLGGGVERDSSGKKAGKGPLVQTELSATLGVSQDQTLICLEGNGSRESHRGDGYIESDTMYTLNTVEQHAVAYSFEPGVAKRLNPESRFSEEISPTLRSNAGDNQASVAYGLGLYNQTATGDVSKTLNSIRSDSDHVPCVAYGLDRASFNQGQNAKFDFSVDEEVAPPIVAKGPGGVMQRLSERCVQEITKE